MVVEIAVSSIEIVWNWQKLNFTRWNVYIAFRKSRSLPHRCLCLCLMSNWSVLKWSTRRRADWCWKRCTLPMLHEIAETSFFNCNFRFTVRIVVGTLFNFLVEHFKKVLLTCWESGGEEKRGKFIYTIFLDQVQGAFNTLWWWKFIVRSLFELLLKKIYVEQFQPAAHNNNAMENFLDEKIHFTYWLCKIGPFFLFRIGMMTSLLFGSGELLSDFCDSSSIFSFSVWWSISVEWLERSQGRTQRNE